MLNIEVIQRYQPQLRKAIHGTKVMYAWEYNDGPDVGLRKYGSSSQHVQDAFVDNVHWLITGDIYEIEECSRQLHSCHEIEAADASNLVVKLRAQGVIERKIYKVPIGVYTVAHREVVNSEFGVLTLK